MFALECAKYYFARKFTKLLFYNMLIGIDEVSMPFFNFETHEKYPLVHEDTRALQYD